MKTEITLNDIMPLDEYARIRLERRGEMTELKRSRRVMVGPDASFIFECFDTMWQQIHEMLYIEKGGAEQIPDEIAAYNPLVPNGRELVATVMFEIVDPDRRAAFLAGLGGVEETIEISFGDHVVKGLPEEDVDRTNADGKASSVQFVHFPFTDEQAEAFKQPATKVTIGISHAKYGHIAIVSEETREALAKDFS